MFTNSGGMTLKERLKESPQIDAVLNYNPTLEYANWILDQLLRFYTLTEIADQTHISRRVLSYMRHRGIGSYPVQLAMEILLGKWTLKLR